MYLSEMQSFNMSQFSTNSDFYSKFESIVTSTREVYANEILFRVNTFNNAHINFLNELRIRNETFLLFMKICNKAFSETVINRNIIININLEIKDIQNPLFLPFLKELLQTTNINPKNINFEILENENIDNENKIEVLSKLKELSKIWFGLVIDDLFSWFSNKERIDLLLSEWINLSLVKIDWKFIQEMYLCQKYWFESLDREKKILGNCYLKNDYDDFVAYLNLLKLNWIKLVAEWIETDELFEFAKSLWFDYFQWYLFQDFKYDEIYKI